MSGKGHYGLSGRILVVEDGTRADSTLAVLCQLYGAETRTATDGTRAMLTGAEFAPEVILIDAAADPDVRELARRIRGEAWGRAAIMILASDWTGRRDEGSAASAGFDAQLVRPVDIETLASLLHELRARR